MKHQTLGSISVWRSGLSCLHSQWAEQRPADLSRKQCCPHISLAYCSPSKTPKHTVVSSPSFALPIISLQKGHSFLVAFWRGLCGLLRASWLTVGFVPQKRRLQSSSQLNTVAIRAEQKLCLNVKYTNRKDTNVQKCLPEAAIIVSTGDGRNQGEAKTLFEY